jgi:hypothetical protein
MLNAVALLKPVISSPTINTVLEELALKAILPRAAASFMFLT